MLATKYARRLEGRRIRPGTRAAVEAALAGDSLREAASKGGCHPSSLHELLENVGLINVFKRARAKRMCRDLGEVPAVYGRYFDGVPIPKWAKGREG